MQYVSIAEGIILTGLVGTQGRVTFQQMKVQTVSG